MIRTLALTILLGVPAMAQVVANGTAEPAQVRTGQATTVRFFADIGDPNLVPGSVNLQRAGVPGRNPIVVGSLSDNGTDGDEIAGDGRYSGEFSINEPAATNITFIISAAIRNQIIRPRSANIIVSVVNNRRPVAVVEPAAPVRVNTQVALDGRNSFDLDRDLLAFSWTLSAKPPGSAAALDNSAFVKPAFTPDLPGTYKATLVVSDGFLTSTPVEVTIPVSASNAVPNAIISGPLLQPFGPGATKAVILDGTSSTDPESTALTYSWRLVAKPASSTAPTFAPLTSATPTLTADKPGRYVIELIVRDGANDSAPAQKTVILYRPNTPPAIGLPADQTVTSAVLINLSATASDPDAGDTIASNVWAFIAKPAGSAAALTGASFTPDVNGDYLLEFTATDNRGFVTRGRVVIRRAPPVGGPVNQPPQVSAGSPQSITLPATASLLATATDDGLPAPPAALTISWIVVNGPTFVTFSNPAALATTATFYAPGAYQLRVTATDGALSAASDVTITVSDTGPVLSPISDRTISLGSVFRLRLAATSTNPIAPLAFSIPTAPGGALLNPTPTIDWTPTAAQVGVHNFTARVADSQGRFDAKSFLVTVLNANRPPVMAVQADASLGIGSAFSRVLTATDPDTGDTLTYALVSGPTGMTITGATLNWVAQGTPYTAYTVIVKVTDAAGLFDVKKFAVTPLPAAAPVATDDTYLVKLNESLNVPAAGVLANDINPSGGTMTAAKLTNPTVGTVTAFGANGAFTFNGPAVLPGPVFQPVLKNSVALLQASTKSPLAADMDGDGKPEIVVGLVNAGQSTGLQVFKENGTLLWQIYGTLPAPNNDCSVNWFSRGIHSMVLGDVDDDGKVEVVVASHCRRDGEVLTGRLVALNGLDGSLKWVSARPYALPMPASGPNPPVNFVQFATPSIGRLRAGESPTVLITAEAFGFGNIGLDTSGNPITGSLCKYIVETATNDICSGVIGFNGTDGTVRTRMVAQRTASDRYDEGTHSGRPPVLVADLDNDGAMEIVAGKTVFRVDGSVKTALSTPDVLREIALGNFDDNPDIEIVRLEKYYQLRLVVYKHDGTVLWSTAVLDGVRFGNITVADFDSSGRPSIVFNVHDILIAFDYKGNIRWLFNARGADGLDRLPERSRAAAFDLDGDGIAEVILKTNDELIFLDGITGKVKHRVAITTIAGEGPIYPDINLSSASPIIIDTDRSGHAKIVFSWTKSTGPFSGEGKLSIVKASDDSWRPSRSVHNQSGYFAGNVNDNGTIPQFPVSNSFANPASNMFGNSQPRIGAIADPRLRYRTSFTYNASVGPLTSNTAKVNLDIAPANRPPVFSSTPPTRYFQNAPFSYTAIATDPDPGDVITYSISFNTYYGGTCSVGPSSGVFSCNGMYPGYTNGEMVFQIRATDSFGDYAEQTLLVLGSSTNSIVPNVIGLTQAAGSSAIVAAGLRVGEIKQSSNPAAAGTIIGQSPGSGSLLSGELVSITVSTGPAPTPVPFVTGLALTVANTTLTSAGFTPAVTRVFSNTVPNNVVISQSPAAGTPVQPVPGNPVSIVVSSGNGLLLSLSTSATTADQTITVTPQAFDVNGQPVSTPSLTYAVTPVLTPFGGSLPAVVGTTITPGALTRGAFAITATDAANGRTASANFAVLPPRVVNESTHGEAFVEMFRALESIFALKPQLVAARDANNTAQMRATLQQMVNIWRTVDLDDVRISFPLVAENQFLLTVEEMSALGLNATPQDLVVNQILREANDDIKAFTDGLKGENTSLSQLQTLADNFATRAARIDSLTVTEAGGIYNRREYQRFLAHRLPAFYEALFEELAVASGLTRRVPGYPYLASKADEPAAADSAPEPRNGPSRRESTLAELAVTTATNYVIDKIMDAGSKVYKNAKQFATDTFHQAAHTAVVVALNSHLKQFVQGGDIIEVVSGASLSFRIFSEPDISPSASPAPLYAQGIIEVPTSALDPQLSTVMIVGPETVSQVTAIYADLKKAFSHKENPATNPQRATNLNRAKSLMKQLKSTFNTIKTNYAALREVVTNAYQTPEAGLPGCIFTSDPSCSQLIYDSGIRPVYRYTPPPGFGGFSGLPVAMNFIVQADDGNMYFGTPAFLPAPVRP